MGVGVGDGMVGQGGYERKTGVFVKMLKKSGVRVGGVGLGGQGGCERRI